MKHALRKDYWSTWFTALLFFVAYYILLVPVPLYLTQRGLPDWEIGLILGTFGVASLIARPLAGVLADGWGYRPVMLLGAFTLMIGAVGMGLTTHPLLLLTVRIFQAIGYVAFTTSVTALVATLAPSHQRGTALAVFGVAANVAITLTPGIVSMGLVILTLEGAFWLSGALAVACGLLAWGVLPNPRQASTVKFDRRALWRVPHQLRLLMLVAGVFGVGYGAFLQFLPLLIERRDLGASGLPYTVYGLGIILTRLVLGRLLDRGDRVKILFPAFVVLALGLGGFAFTNSPALLCLNALLLAISSGVLHPTLIALHVEHSAANECARATSLFYLGFDLGIGLGAWALAPVLQWQGLTSLYLVAACSMMMGIVLLQLLRTRSATVALRQDQAGV